MLHTQSSQPSHFLKTHPNTVLSTALRRRLARDPIPLPAPRLGHPHPRHPAAARRRRGGQFPERRDGAEQSQESRQGGQGAAGAEGAVGASLKGTRFANVREQTWEAFKKGTPGRLYWGNGGYGLWDIRLRLESWLGCLLCCYFRFCGREPPDAASLPP
jgi:hypothetical protein